MKVFVSYAITGEHVEQVADRLAQVRDTVTACGHEVYCFHFDPARREDMTEAECIHHALGKLPKNDALLVLGASERRSEGMLMEVGSALTHGKRLVYAQHDSAVGKTYLPSLADYTFVWRSEQELLSRIREYFGGGI